MYVTVCGHRIPVTVENDLRDDDNQPTYGLFRPGQSHHGTIVLDCFTPMERRRKTLIHEIGEAYDYHVGRLAADDTEGRHNRASTIDYQFTIDLQRQGGEIVLHRAFGDSAVPPELAEAGDPLREPYYESENDGPKHVTCPACKRIYRDREVRNGPITFDWELNTFVMPRTLFCTDESCFSRSRVLQYCTWDGQPLPRVVGKPTIERVEIPAGDGGSD